MTDDKSPNRISKNLEMALFGTVAGGIISFGGLGYSTYANSESYALTQDMRRVQQIEFQLSKPKGLKKLVFEKSIGDSTQEARYLRVEKDSLEALDSYNSDLEIRANKVRDVNLKTGYLMVAGLLTFLTSLSLGIYSGYKLNQK